MTVVTDLAAAAAQLEADAASFRNLFTSTLVTADATLVAWKMVDADTSGGAFTLTLPASPSRGDRVYVNCVDESWVDDNLLVEGDGATIGGDDAVCTLDIARMVCFIYSGADWNVRFLG